MVSLQGIFQVLNWVCDFILSPFLLITNTFLCHLCSCCHSIRIWGILNNERHHIHNDPDTFDDTELHMHRSPRRNNVLR